MPPSTGTDLPHDDPRSRPNDYFKLDLEVVVPQDWIVAGPGKSELLKIKETFHYRLIRQPDTDWLLASTKEGFKAAGIHFGIYCQA